MRQVPLPLKKDHLVFENFLDPDGIIVPHLQNWLTCPSYFHIHIEGAAKTGKTHLLHAAINATPLDQRIVMVQDNLNDFDLSSLIECDLLIIDNAHDVLTSIERSQFVHLYNGRLNTNQRLITTQNLSHPELPDDIASRMHSAIKLITPTMHSENQLTALLQLIAKRSGYTLPTAVTNKLTHHFARDAGSQIDMLEQYLLYLQRMKKNPSAHSLNEFLKPAQ